ncbi:transposase, partial [Candidatus Halobeggiatoa sp. HSG11]|nr:transposase [Candidatus Halobeggiatoa sp. HSG11]
ISIPPYSPQLNIIEMLWRKMKYEWMPFSAYTSFESLQNELFNTLKNIGDEYIIEYTL